MGVLELTIVTCATVAVVLFNEGGVAVGDVFWVFELGAELDALAGACGDAVEDVVVGMEGEVEVVADAVVGEGKESKDELVACGTGGGVDFGFKAGWVDACYAKTGDLVKGGEVVTWGVVEPVAVLGVDGEGGGEGAIVVDTFDEGGGGCWVDGGV